MTTSCPNGHDSEWPDWCSVCGERLGAVEAGADSGSGAPPIETAPTPGAPPIAAPPTPSGPTCDNCGVARHEHDVFCESCGYDFASGSLPEGAAPAASETPGTGDTPPDISTPTTPMHAKISVDADFFAASVGDVDLTLPDPLPDTQIVPLPGTRILIGRKSTSRGIFPEIDVRELTDDPAVSSRHAMLERDADGAWTLTDLGSTNGTFLSPAADDAIEAGLSMAIGAGAAIYLGAWTRITVDETSV